MMRGSLTFLAVMVAALLATGCGGSKSEIKASPQATVFAPADGTVSGKSIKVSMASTTIDRVRTQRLVDFSDTKAPQAAVLVYGGFQGTEGVLTLQPDFNFPADLVFINKDKKAVKLYASDDRHYTPFGAKSRVTQSEDGANSYTSGEPASVVLALPRGKAAEFGISVGSTVEISPDPYAAIAKADPNGIELFFRARKLKDPEIDEIADPIRFTSRVAITAEDRARGILDGENAVVLFYQHEDTDWHEGGFWLKGKTGEFSIAFMRLQQGTGGGPIPFTGTVQDVVEGMTDSGTEDLSRPTWWPSASRAQAMDEVSPTGRGNQVQGPINAVLVVRGRDGIKKLGIEEDMWILGAPLTLQTPSQSGGSEGNRVEKNSLNGLIVTAGGESYTLKLMQTQSDMDAAASGVLLYRMGHLSVFAWDSAAKAAVRNYRAADAKIALLKHTADNRYSVDKIVTVPGHLQSAFAIADAPSRFGVLLTEGVSLKAGDDVVLPWQAHNVRPVLGRGAFWKGKSTIKQSTHAPKDSTAITLEVVQTEADISKGLMFRRSLPENQGMLFIFSKPDMREFWMKNCEMDIDVAFVAEDFTISVIREMKKPAPGTRESELELYSSRRKVLYAVEMEGGWFKKNGISEGDRLWLPPSLRQRTTK